VVWDTDSGQGVFFTNSTGTNVQAGSYLKTTGNTVYCNVPAGLSGPQQFSIVQSFSGHPRPLPQPRRCRQDQAQR
jgi:hypothetical protein